jgi:hypothetical protein
MNNDLLYPPTLSSLNERLYATPTPSSDILELSIKAHQEEQGQRIRNYLEAASKRVSAPAEGVYFLQETRLKSHHPQEDFLHAWRTENTGGYYIRQNGKGIVINPGPHFLDYFHQQGLHIKDIDVVIVTSATPDAYSDIKDIHTINAQLNKISSEFHLIHYYLIQGAHENLATTLKPHFTQERNTIHRLEFFVDSPEVERIEIAPSIILNYFSNEKNKQHQSIPRPSSLGIRIDLLQKERPLRIAYISETAWTPFLAHDVANCDLLIAGFGNTSADDYQKIRYNENCLGFFGCLSLLEELKPRLMICTEFDGRDGDIRLEIIKKLRNDYIPGQAEDSRQPTIIPGNTGLFLDLKEFKILCNSSRKLTALEEILAIKINDKFHPFLYLSSSCRA